MIFAIILVLLSCYLEGILSTYIPLETYLFTPLFTWISCLLCHSFFFNQKNYLWFCFGVAIFYDIVYTDTLLFHAILFVFTCYLFQKITACLSNNKFSFIFSLIISIFFYRMISYFILISIGYFQWDLHFFFQKLNSSFFLNILYGILLSVLFHHFKKKKYHFLKTAF